MSLPKSLQEPILRLLREVMVVDISLIMVGKLYESKVAISHKEGVPGQFHILVTIMGEFARLLEEVRLYALTLDSYHGEDPGTMFRRVTELMSILIDS